jgi:basic amino acid/polyamine antiporter, APA family
MASGQQVHYFAARRVDRSVSMTNSKTGGAAPRIGTLTATAIVVADMIGVGVFTSLGFQVKDISSGFVLLLLWVVGGVVALCGAICYAELALMFPRSSGEYNFLTRSYHSALGFLAGWLSATVGFAAPVALAAMAFGEYFKAVAPGAPPLLLGLGLIWLIAVVQLLGIRQSDVFQTASTIIKLVLIAAFIVAGFTLGRGQPISFAPAIADTAQLFSAPFAIGLVFVMYSYAGWNAATYITEEIKDPNRSLPWALFGGTLIVVALYVALNAVFLYSTPIEKLSGQLDVAVIAGNHIFGEWGGRIVGGLISIGLVSSVSAMMWIGPRVTMTMGQDFPMLRVFSRKRSNGVPGVAILFQAAVASVLLGTQTFDSVLEFIQFSLIFCSFLVVAGVIKLRFTHPQLARPYRAWGYPLTPLVFLSVTAFMMYYLITTKPMQSLAGFAMMLVGLIIYWIAQTSAAQASARGATGAE